MYKSRYHPALTCSCSHVRDQATDNRRTAVERGPSSEAVGSGLGYDRKRSSACLAFVFLETMEMN